MIHACLLLLFAVPCAHAATAASKQVQGVNRFIQQGEIDMAISTAHALLKDTTLNADERMGLLQAVAKAESLRASSGGFEHVDAAIEAYRSLIQDFPKQVDIAKLQWKIAWLYWNHGNPERADTAAQTILQDYPSSPEVKKATLLRARIMIKKGRYSDARFLLLEHFGLGSAVGSRDEAQGIAWMGVVDFADHRPAQAWKSLKRANVMAPDLIRGDATLYATYVQLLAHRHHDKIALKEATDFIRRYITTPEAPAVRLVRADLLADEGRIGDAKELYGILTNSYGNTIVGKKANIRRVMLDIGTSTNPQRLTAAIHAIDKLAAANQLSNVEAEARLAQARLLARLGASDAKQLDDAIAYYAIAAASVQPDIVPVATREGATLLDKRLHGLLGKGAWLQAALLWKRYPQLRPDQDTMLAFAIAGAYARLADYAHAETLYQRLYGQAEGTLLGQRIMLRMARLWLARGDADGAKKVMHWLSAHHDDLYRQEMLLTMAQMQANQGAFAPAEATMVGINPQTLDTHLLPDYWQTMAMLHVGMQQWQDAASAWSKAAALRTGDAHWQDMRALAHAQMQAGDYTAAGQALQDIPDARHDAGWVFAMALCKARTGRWDDASQQLKTLADAAPANAYTLRAQMVLADHEAHRLEESQQ
jgi:tetratricopeptide (TPR) repeat protein